MSSLPPSILKTRSLMSKTRGGKKNKTRKVGWKEKDSLFHTYTSEEYDRKSPDSKEYNNAKHDVTDETTKQNTIKNSVIYFVGEEEKNKEGNKKTTMKKGARKKGGNKKKKNIIIS